MDADEIAARFAGRLRELRLAKGWSQGELAEKSGLKQAGVANLEQARTHPEWRTVIRLCIALGVTCAEFQKPPADAEGPGRGRPKMLESKRLHTRKAK